MKSALMSNVAYFAPAGRQLERSHDTVQFGTQVWALNNTKLRENMWDDSRKEHILPLLRERVAMMCGAQTTLVSTAGVRAQWSHSTANWWVVIVLAAPPYVFLQA